MPAEPREAVLPFREMSHGHASIERGFHVAWRALHPSRSFLREGLSLCHVFAILVVAADAVGDTTRQAAGCVSSACTARDSASSLPVPFGSAPPSSAGWVGGPEPAAVGALRVILGLKGSRQGESSAAVQHSRAAWTVPCC